MAKPVKSLRTLQRNEEFRQLRERGWKLREIAAYANLSHQRVDAIIKNKPTRQAKTGTVYVVRAGSAIKIGVTKNLKQRLLMLQAGCPLPVVMLFTLSGGRELEAELHRRFEPSLLWGEWFRLTKEVKHFISEHSV